MRTLKLVVFLLALITGGMFGQTNGDIPSWDTNRWKPKQLVDTLHIVINFAGKTSVDSFTIFHVKKSGLTIIGGEAKRTGGTSATVNIKKNGTTLFTNYVTTTSFASMGTVAGGALTIGDSLMVCLREVTGASTDLPIGIWYTRVLK